MKRRFLTSKKLLLVLCALAGITIGKAQVLDNENKIAVTLKDGTSVICYGKAGNTEGQRSNEYYYLPTNLRLSKNKSGDPEFLFMKYITDARAENGGVDGALMHFLMEWGLTDVQLKETEEKLKEKNRAAKLLGPAQVETEGEKSFNVLSATLNTPGETLLTSGGAPVLPGSKVVVAAKLDKNMGQLMVSSLDKAASDVSLNLRFKYRTLMPAAKGRITIHWSKIYEKYQKDSAKYTSNERTDSYLWGLWSTTSTTESNYGEVRKSVESLISNKFIDFQFDELDPNSEKVKPIREGFMTMLTQMMGDVNQANDSKPPAPEETEAMPDIKHGTSYTFNREKFMKKIQVGTEVFNLNYRSTYYLPADITTNLSSWYNSFKSNPNCVSSIFLNDPFFERRDAVFILNAKMQDWFDDKEINYVTINMLKKRPGGNDFSGRTTIDKKYLTEKGLRASFTYARGQDTNPNEIEYQTQWSFTDGTVYPQNPQWEKNSWESNTVSAPLSLDKLDFQTDIDKLKENKIVRVSLQVRYKKFNEEREITLPISASGTDGMLSKNIYHDPTVEGYAYRLIYYTTEGERLATDWKPKRNDWFVYAAVPDELKDKTTETFKKALDAGKVLVDAANGKVSGDTVLDKFSDVLGITKN